MKAYWKTMLFYSMTIGILLTGAKMWSDVVTAFSENGDIGRKYCIVIDPGHGGEDGGAVSCSGIPESYYNLEISCRLKALLNLLGYETKLIRSSDISVYTKGDTLAQKKASDLKERVKIVNETNGAVLLSVHQNYFSDNRYTGAQVFYANTEGSEQLARNMQSALVSVLNPGSQRREKKCSGVYLMEHIHCPGVLIECGFLSNPQEDMKLKDAGYQKKLCSVIAAVTSQYLSNT